MLYIIIIIIIIIYKIQQCYSILLLLYQFLSSLYLFVELLNLFVVAEALLMIRIQFQTLPHLTAQKRKVY